MKRNALLTYLAACLLILALNAYSQSENRADWYRNATMLINIDTYPRNFDAAKSPEYKEQIRELIKRTNATMIYYHCTSQDGYTKYQSKAGIVHPRLDRLDMVRIWRDVTREMGVKLFAYFSYAVSEAEGRAHPEFLQCDVNGQPRPNRLCSNSGYVDTYVLPKMRELVEDYDVDGFWVDASTWSVRACYCPNCVEKFRKLYGQEPPKEQSNPIWLKYAEFQRESFERQSKRMSDLVHELNPECIYIPNYAFSVYQPEKVPYYVDAITGDVGHNRRTQMVSFKARFQDTQEVPWDIMVGVWYGIQVNVLPNGQFQLSGPLSGNPSATKGTLQHFGMFKSIEYLNQENAIVRANGGITSLFVHTMQNSALSPHCTELLGQMSDFIHERLDVFQDTRPVRDIGILHSASTYYSEGDGYCHLQPAMDRLEGAHIALIQNNYHVNIFADYELDGRLQDYRIVVLSQQSRLTPEAVDAIRDYVNSGGTIVVAGKIAMDPGSPDYPRSLLEDVLGVRFLDEPVKESAYLPWRDLPLRVNCDWYPVVMTTADKILPVWRDEDEFTHFELPYPAITVNDYGKGKAVFIAGDIFTGYFRNQFYGVRDIIEMAMTAGNDQKPFETDAPIAVEFSMRRKNDDLILHMVNRLVDWDMDTEGAIWSEHIPPAGPFYLKVRCKQEPRNVVLKPSNEKLNWNWSNEFITVTVPKVHIHQALVVENE